MAIVILALIIVFTGKIDFGNPTSKEDKVNEEKTKEDDPDDVETTMVESGDDYELEGIATLHFADDALEEEAEISFIEYESEGDVEGALSPPMYNLSLDSQPVGDVVLDLALPEGYEKEEVIFGVQVDAYDVSEDKEVQEMIYIVADEVKDGYASITLLPDYFSEQDDDDKALVIDKNSVYAAGGKKYVASVGIFDSQFYYEGGHFSVINQLWFSSLGQSSATAFLDDLEKVHDDFLAKDYSYKLRDNWPFYVYIKILDVNGGYYISKTARIFGKDPDRGWMSINSSYFREGYKSGGALMPLLYHEWFHFIQSNYGDHDTEWFDEASATYFESVASGGVPNIISEYWELAFESMIPYNNTAKDGYARQPFVKFLVNRYGEDIIRQIYLSLEKGDNLSLAITTNTLASRAELVNPYYVDLASGLIGTNQAYTLCTNIESQDDRYKQLGAPISLAYPDDTMSYTTEELMNPIEVGTKDIIVNGEAPPYLMPLDVPQDLIDMMNENTTLTVESSGGIITNLVKIKSKNVESYTGGFNIENYGGIDKDLKDDWKYMLVLVNNTQEAIQSTVSVKLKLAPTMDELVGNWMNSAIEIKEFYMSPEFEALMEQVLEGMMDEMTQGCETEEGEPVSFEDAEALEGQIFSAIIGIAKISDTEGTIAYEQVTESDDSMFQMDPLSFSYDNGLMESYSIDEEVELNLTMNAYYVDKETVGISGDISADYSKGMLLIKVGLKGTKAKDDI